MTLIRMAFASFLLAFSFAVASAQAPDAEGRWALIADGRPLAILELHRDSAAPGGWTGSWIRPEQMTISQSHTAFDIRGPLVRRTIVDARERDGLLELALEGRPGQAPSRHTFRTTGPDHGEFGWIDPLAIPPLPLARAGLGTAVNEQWDARRSYAITTPRNTNPEMAEIFAADQADRGGGAGARIIEAQAMIARDLLRRERTRELLDSGALQSGDDFYHAAFIFQHGDATEDYLLAHTLAIVAAARGRPDAAWIAAATMDRYLQSIGRPQIYGTQFSNREAGGYTQEPYNRTVVSDALRAALGVPAQDQQAVIMRELESQHRAESGE